MMILIVDDKNKGKHMMMIVFCNNGNTGSVNSRSDIGIKSVIKTLMKSTIHIYENV